MTAIQGEHISLQRGHFQLDDVNITLPAGQLTAIVGPNGSGKSTLLRIMTRLLKQDQGQVSVLGKPVQEYKRRDFAQTITMLPQMKDMLPLLTVRELVAYGRSPHAKGLRVRHTGQDQQIVGHVMKITGIQPYADRMFHTLSGGEQQKARIAMALAQQTGILLLDEPTTFLDIAHQFEVMDMLRRINHESGLTIVMVLHDLQQAAAYCHHMIALKKGRIAVAGEPREILTSAFLRDIYEMNATIKFEDGYPVIIPTIPHHSGGI